MISDPQVCIRWFWLVKDSYRFTQCQSAFQIWCVMSVFAPVRDLSDSEPEVAARPKAKSSAKIMKKPSAAVASSEPSGPGKVEPAAAAAPKRKSALKKAKEVKTDGNEESPKEVTGDETLKLVEKSKAKKADFFHFSMLSVTLFG